MSQYRYSKRKYVNIDASIYYRERCYRGTVRNINQEGVCFQTTSYLNNLHRNGKVFIELHEKYRFEGRIVHQRDNCIGIMFCEHDPNLLKSIVPEINTNLDKIQILRWKLGAILRKLKCQLNADVITLFVYDSDTDEFYLPIGYGLEHPVSFFDPAMRPDTSGIAGKIVKHNKDAYPLNPNLSGSSALAAPFIERENIKYDGGFPLVHEGRALGVLFVSYRRQHSFIVRDIEIIHTAVRHAASAISVHNKADNIIKVLRQAQERNLSGVDRIIQTVTKLAWQTLNRPIAIWLLEPQRHILSLRSIVGLPEIYFKSKSFELIEDSPFSMVINTNKELPISDIYNSNMFNFSDDKIWNVIWTSSMLAFPINSQGKTIGVHRCSG